MPQNVRAPGHEPEQPVEGSRSALAGHQKAGAEEVGSGDSAPIRLIGLKGGAGNGSAPEVLERGRETVAKCLCLFEGKGQPLTSTGVQIARGVTKQAQSLGGTLAGVLLERTDGTGGVGRLRFLEAIMKLGKRGQQGTEQSPASFEPGTAPGFPENSNSDVSGTAGGDIGLHGWTAVYFDEPAPGLEAKVLAYAEAGPLGRATFQSSPLADAGSKAICANDEAAVDRGTFFA